ncbi:zona pellucida-like domain-containing protein 1 [Genypterus blacodes]|uniref:zona pellucida-like domain-containing protein 1 n=1 Tax=Genypterus blacodes TaxID=154954 RepID=UPI003F76AB4E
MCDSDEDSSRDRQAIMRERGRRDAVATTQGSGTTWLALLVYQLATLALTQAQNNCIGHPTFRHPETHRLNSVSASTDITVLCGTQTVELHILLCPIYFSGYNESLVALNSLHDKKECGGVADWTVDPPVVIFNFSMKEEGIAACSNTMRVTQESGTGVFSEFSYVQYVNISGMVCSHDPTPGLITYNQESMYQFSCKYPLQYLIQNTSLSVTGTSLNIKDGNGSFISTLSMQLYSDPMYTASLRIPPRGLELKTKIYVQVKASNLTSNFNVLLDRCFATLSPYPISSTFHDLFVGCNRDSQTMMVSNGEKQEARFSFEAFRFIQQNDTVATFYIHCATRLCAPAFCSVVQNCTTSNNLRRRRGVRNSDETTVSEAATITSGPIIIHANDSETRSYVGINERINNDGRGRCLLKMTGLLVTGSSESQSGTLLGVGIIAGIVGAFCVTLVAFIAYQKYNPDFNFRMRTLNSLQ